MEQVNLLTTPIFLIPAVEEVVFWIREQTCKLYANTYSLTGQSLAEWCSRTADGI